LISLVNKNAQKAMRALLRLDDDLADQVDQVGLHYDKDGVHVKHRLMRYHDFFVKRLQRGEQVLDVGCGYGAVAWSMATRAGAIVTAIDLSDENIKKALRLYQHSNITFIAGDALKCLPLRPFDTVVVSNVLEHIEHRVEFVKMVQETVHPRRWLIRVPMVNRHWLVSMRKELDMFYFSDRTHFTEYTFESLEEELRTSGLVITHQEFNWGEIWVEAVSNA
jgi:2-polyprenyl-3-methyl-5-hydroxy-6-metoxy-1,4-benzoquinol methylase